MAVNCSVLPVARDAFAGVTAIDVSTGEVTVSVVEPCMAPEVAAIVVLPAIKLLASPTALIVATLGDDELHTTDPVRFCILPSEYVPVAVNCCGKPAAMLGFDGVTAMEFSTGTVTNSVVEPEKLPIIALMLEAPADTPVAKPPAVIVATPGADELQVA